MSSQNVTLTRRRKFGYATGIFTDSVIYNAFYVYFMIFLTNVVGVEPVFAGTISLCSVCVDAVTDPIMGWIMDLPKVNAKKVMLFGGIISGIAIGLVFYPVSGSPTFQFIYYVGMTAIMWCAYTAFCIPYYAIAPQLTTDYNELTQIRGLSSTINSFAIYVGCVFPILMITFFSENGIGYGNSWSMAGFGIGIIAIFFAFINYYSLKNVELIEREVKLSEGFFKVLGEVIKLKPLKFLLLFIFFFIFGNAMVSANQNYIIIYVAGSDPDALAGTVLMTMLSFLILSPIVTKISEKWDRKLAISICFVISVIGSVVIRIIGIHSLLPLYFLSVVHSFALVGFWCLFYAFCYDIVALDQYKYGKNREGFIVAFPNLILKFANAVGLQAIGIILALIGYDATAEVQSAGAVAGIANISTIYFAILVVIALVLILTYPINKKVYNKLLTAVEQKNNGNLEYHDPDLDKLI